MVTRKCLQLYWRSVFKNIRKKRALSADCLKLSRDSFHIKLKFLRNLFYDLIVIPRSKKFLEVGKLGSGLHSSQKLLLSIKDVIF